MTILTRNLREDVTHWPLTGTDGYGGFTYGTPVKIVGRWEEKAVLFLNADNEEVISEAIVYLDTDVAPGDYLGQGDLAATADPTTIDGPKRIRQRQKTTDLRNLLAIRKAFL
jgi:hypothetical protein